MGKVTKTRKKTKNKSKKSSRNKSKSNKLSMTNIGAPEIRNEDNIINHDMKDSGTEIKLMRRAMKAKHVEIHDKAIRKAQRSFNKISKTGNEDDILVAQKLLNEVIQEREEAMEWSHPEVTI